jgi:hypothetical protein
MGQRGNTVCLPISFSQHVQISKIEGTHGTCRHAYRRLSLVDEIITEMAFAHYPRRFVVTGGAVRTSPFTVTASHAFFFVDKNDSVLPLDNGLVGA